MYYKHLLIMLLSIPGFWQVSLDKAGPGAPFGGYASAERTITLSLNANLGTAFLLFSPSRETEWDPNFRPQVLYQPGRNAGRTATVFVTGSGTEQATWVIAADDAHAHYLRYVGILPGIMATVIDIQCKAISTRRTQARITYLRTALSARGVRAVTHFASQFTSEAPHWEQVLNDYLTTKSARKLVPESRR